MKKALALIMALVLLTLTLAGCAAKEPLTADGFTDYAESHDFSVMDVRSSSGMEEDVDVYLVASNGNYDLEYLSCPSAEEAEQGYANICASLDDSADVITMSVEVNGTNSQAYYFNSKGLFYMAFRVENTIICGMTDESFRSEILEHVEAMGYK